MAFIVATTASCSAEDQWTPVIASSLRPVLYAVEGTDAKRHFVYELVITNTGNAVATIQKIDVVSAEDLGKVLATFQGEGLLSRLRPMGRGAKATARIQFSERRLLLVGFVMDKGVRPPGILLHRFQVMAGGTPGSAPGATQPYTYLISPITVSTAMATLGPPLTGKGWVALNGCCQAGGVHRGSFMPINGELHFAQRFAIDWMQLDAQARLTTGDGKNVQQYPDYGSKVIAVADGEVVDTLDTLDDQVPGVLPDPKTINLTNVDGNHIVIDIGQGRYAFYAHLQKHSLLVAKGAHVKRGQVLALLGNTGNTSAPHLHFHLMDGPSVLGSSGLPYVIDQFSVSGQLSEKQFEDAGVSGTWSKGLWPQVSARKMEFPIDLTVVDF